MSQQSCAVEFWLEQVRAHELGKKKRMRPTRRGRAAPPHACFLQSRLLNRLRRHPGTPGNGPHARAAPAQRRIRVQVHGRHAHGHARGGALQRAFFAFSAGRLPMAATHSKSGAWPAVRVSAREGWGRAHMQRLPAMILPIIGRVVPRTFCRVGHGTLPPMPQGKLTPRGFAVTHGGYTKSNQGMRATRTFVAPCTTLCVCCADAEPRPCTALCLCRAVY